MFVRAWCSTPDQWSTRAWLGGLLRAATLLGALGGCGGTDPEESAAAFPKPCSDIYAADLLPAFELEMAQVELAALERDCENRVKQYRPATFKYGDETAEVMVRLKGNWSWRCDKKQFVISFNEVDAKARFHGLRKLMLDAAWYEPTLFAERLGFDFLTRLGTHSSCVNNATLKVNGENYGLYSNVERLDKEYLQRHFSGSDADGNLYDGGEELETNEELGDVSRRDRLFSVSGSLDEIEQMSDLDQAIGVWAGLAMLPDIDSYWAGVEINYFLYDHPQRGFLWLPYDMDMTAPTGEFDDRSSSVELGLVERYVRADPFTYENPDWSKEQLFQTVLRDEARCSQFLAHLKDALQVYDVARMQGQLDEWARQVAGALAEDPNLAPSEHAAAVATMKAFMVARREFVEAWLQTAACPVTAW